LLAGYTHCERLELVVISLLLDLGVNAGLKVLNTAKIIVLSPINIYAPP
jgi:hypothetical protein